MEGLCTPATVRATTAAAACPLWVHVYDPRGRAAKIDYLVVSDAAPSPPPAPTETTSFVRRRGVLILSATALALSAACLCVVVVRGEKNK